MHHVQGCYAHVHTRIHRQASLSSAVDEPLSIPIAHPSLQDLEQLQAFSRQHYDLEIQVKRKHALSLWASIRQHTG